MPTFTQKELDELTNTKTDIDEMSASMSSAQETVSDHEVELDGQDPVEKDSPNSQLDADGSASDQLNMEIVASTMAGNHSEPERANHQEDSNSEALLAETDPDHDNDIEMLDAESKSETDDQAGDAEEGEGGEEDGDEEDSTPAENDSDDGSSDGEEEEEVEEQDAEEESNKSTTTTDEEGEEEEEEEEDEDAESAEEGSGSDEEAHGDASRVTCLYCKQVDEKDVAKEGSLLRCGVCGKYAHKDCARQDRETKPVSDPESWQCKDCNQIPGTLSPDESGVRKSTAPRLVRDLLPVSRGVQKPNSHSIFAQPLISEGEEGGRALRKRKSPTSEPLPVEKRTRRATPKVLSNAATDDADSTVHATRRASQKLVPTARILQHRPPHKPPPHKFILAFRLDQSKIEKILSKPPRPGKRRDRRRPPKIPPPPITHAPVPKFPALPTNHLIFPSMWGDRENDINAKPYGGILSEQESDTSRSLPQLKDREIFEIARNEAEEERRRTSAAAEAEINGENANTTKPSRTVSGPPSKIKCIQFGKHVIDTFYAAPYPEEYSHESRLFICEFCLKYLPSEFVAYRHKLKCPAKHPPGDEIYRDGSISIWEVDGRKKTEYCQCLCLMAKMFLGSKTLYYDVEPFLFYILTEYDEVGYHFVGYFSKEKRPASQNNVSCILVMPIHQRKGYATFLIDFSYLLTRIEGKDGSPEKPLSDMGLTAYRSYWDLTIAKTLLDIGMKPFSTKDLMQRTGMTADDVIHSLERLYAFVRDPVTKVYAIRYDKQLYDNIIYEYESKKHRVLRPDNLVWTPYIMGRSDQAHLDGQPLQTVAPREGEDNVVDEVQSSKSKADVDPEDPVSPKTVRDHSRQQTTAPEAIEDPQLVNATGQVAPGPPTTKALTETTSSDVSHGGHQVNGAVNGYKEANEDDVTGYALAYRMHNIPPSRFQIDPPIPAAMLRARLNKRKAPNRRTDSTVTESPAPGPVRSSPRHAASVNGSVSDAASPEKPSTPVRRSVRKSGLANMQVVGIDGSGDEDEQEDEIEAKARDEEDEDEEDEESSEDEDEEAVETESDEEDDEDAEVPDDEDDDDDDDPEVEIEEDEEDDDEDDEEEE